MITETLIRKMEAKTAAIRTDAVDRLGRGVPLSYISQYLNGCDAIEEAYQEMMRDQLELEERRRVLMKKKKSPSKLKLAKTAKAKKLLKAKK